MRDQVILRSGPVEGPFIVRVFGVSEEEFFRITDEDTYYELLDGVLIMHSPASLEHEDLISFLNFVLRGFVDEHELGRVLGSHAAVRTVRGRIFEPDLKFVAHSRAGVTEQLIEGTADLIIEILSPSTRDYDLGEKRRAYREARTPEIWFVDREREEVLQDLRVGSGYRSRVLHQGLLRSKSLAGLSLPVEWLWKRPLPNSRMCLDALLSSKTRPRLRPAQP